MFRLVQRVRVHTFRRYGFTNSTVYFKIHVLTRARTKCTHATILTTMLMKSLATIHRRLDKHGCNIVAAIGCSATERFSFPKINANPRERFPSLSTPLRRIRIPFPS